MHPAPALCPRPRRAHQGRRIAALATAIVLVVLTACSGTESASPPGQQEGGASPAASPTTSAPPAPDVLPDPGVAVGDCKQVTYTPATSKQPMIGELCRPKANQRDVAVIVVHGGSGIGGSYDGMRRWAQRYLVEGYVTFLPEYHLFNVGGESPVFPRPEQNIKAAVQYVRGTGNALGINKNRIVVQGQSAGARVGAVAFTTPDDPWFAGAELHTGVSDAVNGFIGFYHPYDGTMQYAYQYFGGDDTSRDPKVIERLDKGDSLAHATASPGPALFITGSEDWDVIQDQQNAFVDVLHRQNLGARAVVVKGGGHGFDEGGPRLSKLGEQAAVDTLAFLNESYPQDPAREPQSGDADVNDAPTYTGVPPTTYATRPTSPGGYNQGKQTTPTTYRYVPQTTSPPTTVKVVPTTAPAPTAPPTTVPAPTSTRPAPAPTTTRPAPGGAGEG